MVFYHLLKNFYHLLKNFGNKYGRKLMDTATKTWIDAAEATGDLIGNKIADQITSIAKPKENEMEVYIPSEKRQQIIDDFRLF